MPDLWTYRADIVDFLCNTECVEGRYVGNKLLFKEVFHGIS